MPRLATASRFWTTGAREGGAPLEGGLAHGHLHEFYAADPDDPAAAAGLVAGLAIATTDNAATDNAATGDATTGNTCAVVWLRSRRTADLCGVIQGAGWAELGGAPGSCLFVLADDATGLLRAGVDVVRSGGAGVVVIEDCGRMPELDLTASRRLSLAAERSGVLLLLVRSDARPVPSAAETRWSVTSAPSQALPANAPGLPTFDIELLRHRASPAGGRWRLEWDRDRRIFRDAAVSGAVVPVPVCGTPDDPGRQLPDADIRHAA